MERALRIIKRISKGTIYLQALQNTTKHITVAITCIMGAIKHLILYTIPPVRERIM